MHFDNLGLGDYYFIDPHWLYYVFCQVCTSSMLTCSSKIDSKYILVLYNRFISKEFYFRSMTSTKIKLFKILSIIAAK